MGNTCESSFNSPCAGAVTTAALFEMASNEAFLCRTITTEKTQRSTTAIRLIATVREASRTAASGTAGFGQDNARGCRWERSLTVTRTDGHPPGTVGKQFVLESRAAAGVALWHPADARFPADMLA